jgi:predicted esterase
MTRKKFSTICLALVISLFVVTGLIAQEVSDPWATVTDWLVSGPFPSLGSMPEFYRDNLEKIGGEQGIEPVEGLTLSSKSYQTGTDQWYGKVSWQPYQTKEDGYVDFGRLYTTKTGELAGPWRRISYAYCTIESPEDQRVLFEVRTNDALQMWVNHEEVIYNRLFRGGWRQGGVDVLVIDLKRGPNTVLVKLGDYRYSGWGFVLRWKKAKGRLYINHKDVLLPHLRIGEKLAGWAYVSLINTTDERLKGIEIEVRGNRAFLPKTTRVPSLKPKWDSRAAFWVETRKEVQAADKAEIEIAVRMPGEEFSLLLKPEVRNRGEYFTRTYLSDVDNSVQPYSLLVPPAYNGRHPFPLLIALHGAHVKECIGSYKLKDWCIIATAYGRGNTGFREIGANDVFSVVDEIKKRYSIDDSRIYLAGHSMGGHGTWYLGAHYPDQWAALNPMSGYGDYRLMEQDIHDWQVLLYEDRSAIFFLENLVHLPVYTIHGVKDDDVTVEQPRRLMAALKNLGYKNVYDEHPDKPHWWGMDFPEALEFLRKHKRNPYPKEVILKTNRLKYNRSYWVKIDAIKDIHAMARVHAKIEEENRISVEAENVFQYSLLLNKHLLDFKQPVVIKTNDVRSFEGVLPSSGKVTLRAVLNNQDEIEKYVPVIKPARGVVKTHELFGPIIDAYNSRFIYVYGTSGTAEDTEVNRREARQDALDWRTWANGNSVIKSDQEVTSEDIETNNLILYGGPETNALVAGIKDKLPIRIEKNCIRVGDREFRGEDIGVKFVYPNPLNPSRYVLINAGVTSKAVDKIHRLGDPLYDPLPDYIIFSRQDVSFDRHFFLAAGFFDRNWEIAGD